jgi:hypothetical protein
MIGDGQPVDSATSGPNKLRQAEEAVQAATVTVKETTQTIANAIEAGRRPEAPLDIRARWTRQAPLSALALAFLFGITINRRRW